MSEQEFRRVAWETIVTRIDDLAACLDAITRAGLPQDEQQVLDVDAALSRLDQARAWFGSTVAPRLVATGWPGGAR